MTFEEYYHWFKAQEGKPEGAVARLQHKGSSMCADVVCECGAHCHIDSDFTYFIRCAECSKLYAVGEVLKLYPLPPEHEAFVVADRENLIQTTDRDRVLAPLVRDSPKGGWGDA
jgi:hypothetical protein